MNIVLPVDFDRNMDGMRTATENVVAELERMADNLAPLQVPLCRICGKRRDRSRYVEGQSEICDDCFDAQD
jgi:hypothetical protein